MPTYEYECLTCGRQQEHFCSMAARPASLSCSCGGECPQVILSVPETFVKFTDYQFRRDKVVGNNGKKFGRNVDQQHAGYQKHIAGVKQQIKRSDRSLSKDAHKNSGIRVLGVMPGEMADSISAQEGHKQAVSKDPDYWFRKTGMMIGDGK